MLRPDVHFFDTCSCSPFLATLAAQKFLEFPRCSYQRQLCPFFMGVWFPGHFEVWNAFSRDRPVSEAVLHGDSW